MVCSYIIIKRAFEIVKFFLQVDLGRHLEFAPTVIEMTVHHHEIHHHEIVVIVLIANVIGQGMTDLTVTVLHLEMIDLIGIVVHLMIAVIVLVTGITEMIVLHREIDKVVIGRPYKTMTRSNPNLYLLSTKLHE